MNTMKLVTYKNRKSIGTDEVSDFASMTRRLSATEVDKMMLR